MGAGCSNANAQETQSPSTTRPQPRPSVDPVGAKQQTGKETEGPSSGSSGFTATSNGTVITSASTPAAADEALPLGEHRGAPAPPEEEGRMRTLKSLNVLDTVRGCWSSLWHQSVSLC